MRLDYDNDVSAPSPWLTFAVSVASLLANLFKEEIVAFKQKGKKSWTSAVQTQQRLTLEYVRRLKDDTQKTAILYMTSLVLILVLGQTYDVAREMSIEHWPNPFFRGGTLFIGAVRIYIIIECFKTLSRIIFFEQFETKMMKKLDNAKMLN